MYATEPITLLTRVQASRKLSKGPLNVQDHYGFKKHVYLNLLPRTVVFMVFYGMILEHFENRSKKTSTWRDVRDLLPVEFLNFRIFVESVHVKCRQTRTISLEKFLVSDGYRDRRCLLTAAVLHAHRFDIRVDGQKIRFGKCWEIENFWTSVIPSDIRLRTGDHHYILLKLLLNGMFSLNLNFRQKRAYLIYLLQE